MDDKITVRVTSDIAEAFESFMKTCPDPLKSRQDGLRFILRDWLTGRGYLEYSSKSENKHDG